MNFSRISFFLRHKVFLHSFEIWKPKISKAEDSDSEAAREKYKSAHNTTDPSVLWARFFLIVHLFYELIVHKEDHNNMLTYTGFFSEACAFA